MTPVFPVRAIPTVASPGEAGLLQGVGDGQPLGASPGEAGLLQGVGDGQPLGASPGAAGLLQGTMASPHDARSD